jgi:putative nucleotidyltransferase with HDIG domain
MSIPNLKDKLHSSLRIKIILLLFTIGLIILMFPHGESIESDVTIGSVWIHDDLIASTTFEILKDPKLFIKEQNQAANQIRPIFVRDDNIQTHFTDSLTKYNVFLLKILKNNLPSKNKLTALSNTSYSTFLKISRSHFNFSGSRINNIEGVLNISKNLLNDIYKKGVLNLLQKEITQDSITIRDGKFENNQPKLMFFEQQSINEKINSLLQKHIGNNRELNEAIEEYMLIFIKPNLLYDYKFTDAAIKNAKEKIPRNVGIVNENERIVAKHDRITPETKLKIESYKKAKDEDKGFWSRLSQNLGKFLHVFIIMSLFMIHIFLFRKKIYNDNLKLVLIFSIILFISLLTFLTYKIDISTPIEFLVLVPVASMLFTIIFDSRVGFYGTVVVSLIVGGLRGNDYAFAVMNIIAGALSAYTVRNMKNRSQIFRSFFYIFLGYSFGIVAFGLEKYDSYDQMLLSFAFAGSNALISPVLTYGLIIFFERIFKITTDLTLLELTDYNNVLLKELAKNAPGTFNHSIAMGTLVETTAEAVGANPILARVGAYYHDIGKTVDPESYVENQINTINIHENLAPIKSVQIIMNHIAKGIELAEKNYIPQEVIDFIPMHHGTTVISYFYEKAKKMYGEENIDINKYRYKGPKPNTKETAIVMLADACESTIRSLNNPEAEKVENVINNLIDSRIEDEQLNESPLTFNDLRIIRESFLSILVGYQHKRLRYPNQEELENKKTES